MTTQYQPREWRQTRAGRCRKCKQPVMVIVALARGDPPMVIAVTPATGDLLRTAGAQRNGAACPACDADLGWMADARTKGATG